MSTLPLYPIGGYPGQSEVAAAAQQKALLLIVVLLLVLGGIGEECGNGTYEFFLQLFALLAAGVFCSANR